MVSLHRLGGEGDGAREGGGLALDGDEEVRAAGKHLRAHGTSKRVKPPREAQSLVAQHVAIRAEDVDGRKPTQLLVRVKGMRDERIPRVVSVQVGHEAHVHERRIHAASRRECPP